MKKGKSSWYIELKLSINRAREVSFKNARGKMYIPVTHKGKLINIATDFVIGSLESKKILEQELIMNLRQKYHERHPRILYSMKIYITVKG